MGPLDLAQVLRPLKKHTHPDLIVGLETSDDAAVYRLGDRAIIQTLDFFPPVVDDPYQFGAIAAANAMSDVYAMGGEVLLALNIVAFPDTLPPEILTEVLRGGADKVAEAGGVLVGGHTVIDKEPKYGLSVVGTVDPQRITTKGGALPGDYLVLTKPVGSGTISTAVKAGKASPEHEAFAVEVMTTLNRRASQLLVKTGVSAMTDITGFGLAGHAFEMADAGKVRFEIAAADVPLMPGAIEYAQRGILPGGVGRNRAYFQAEDEGSPRVRVGASVAGVLEDLLLDPQTSGGLLAAVRPEQMPALRSLFAEAALPFWIIGRVYEGRGVDLV